MTFIAEHIQHFGEEDAVRTTVTWQVEYTWDDDEGPHVVGMNIVGASSNFGRVFQASADEINLRIALDRCTELEKICRRSLDWKAVLESCAEHYLRYGWIMRRERVA